MKALGWLCTSYNQSGRFSTDLSEGQTLLSLGILCIQQEGENVLAGGLGRFESPLKEGVYELDELVSGEDGLREDLTVPAPESKNRGLSEDGCSDVRVLDRFDNVAVLLTCDHIVVFAEEDIGHDVEGKEVDCVH